jgi:RNA ligase (TIGR02306 family)
MTQEVKPNSTHRVEVVPIVLEEHPNADSLSIVRVYGYQVCVNTEFVSTWADPTMGAYIPPDSIVPDTETFEFVGDNKRIKVRSLRGVYSQGIMIEAPAGSKIGDDVAELLNITHYEPPVSSASMKGDNVLAPEGTIPYYDLESWLRYGHLLKPGELVLATEKIHGSNARYTTAEGQQFCGSHHQWKAEDAGNMWWRCLAENGWITTFCQLHPDYMLNGEIFGAVQELRYGATNGQIFFRAFDIWNKNTNAYLGWDEVTALFSDPSFGTELGINWVPVLFQGEYDPVTIVDLVEVQSKIASADHMQEGIVIQTVKERYEPEIGRVKLKIVANQYLVQK